jgi:transcriptional regulator with XRE-family HTH domain
MTSEHPKATHHGRNVKRFREMSKLKQEDLADLLGAPWTQKKLSQLEAKEVIEEEILEEIAKALKVPVDAIKEYDEEKIFYNIQNNYEGSNTTNSNSAMFAQMETVNINTLDKYVEANDRLAVANDRLAEASEKINKLNEALLKEKDEKIALLERMLGAGRL